MNANTISSDTINPKKEICSDAANYLLLLRQALSASLYPESSWRIARSEEERKGILGVLKRYFIRELGKRNYVLVKKIPFDATARENGENWPMFGYSMIGHRRLENIEACLRSVVDDNVEGDFVECGVWRGGASLYAKGVLNILGSADRKVWLADSFEGMPIQTEADKVDPELAASTYLKVSLEEVRENFERFGLLDENVKFIKGWFSETLQHAPINKIAVLRLDGDYYSSTMDALDALFDRVSVGGYTIIDDYNAFESCRKAVADFCSKRNIAPRLTAIDSTGTFWRKT